MESSPTPIHPTLSRTHKSQPYLAARKRKRPSDGDASFEVRPSPRGGVGIFAIEHISCGDLIIAHEEPLVHCRATNDFDPPYSACDLCSAPVGSLRDHVTGRLGFFSALPYLDAWREGLKFSHGPFLTGSCQCQRQAAWCCSAHMGVGMWQHSLLCGSPLLEAFYDAQENPLIFRLAEQALTLILCRLAEQRQSPVEHQRQSPVEQFYFWRDYGSHPLWWEVGSSGGEKKQRAEKFVKVLTKSLHSSRRRYIIEDNTSMMWMWRIIDGALIREICSLGNVGHILGVLQCNAMEFEYPSPRQQYVEHFEEAILECTGEDTDAENDTTANELKSGCQWLVDNVLNSSTGSDGEEESNPALDPIKGSGLYPVLTLANHDCNPNASIEFLQESNRGSMVATRDIAVGEEIFITYVPNGGVGGGDGPKFFRHCEPTRTWKWLNARGEDDMSDGSEESDDNDESNEADANEDCDSSADECNRESLDVSEHREEGLPLEGSDLGERAHALLEYGFECRCNRCSSEQKKAPAEE